MPTNCLSRRHLPTKGKTRAVPDGKDHVTPDSESFGLASCVLSRQPRLAPSLAWACRPTATQLRNAQYHHACLCSSISPLAAAGRLVVAHRINERGVWGPRLASSSSASRRMTSLGARRTPRHLSIQLPGTLSVIPLPGRKYPHLLQIPAALWHCPGPSLSSSSPQRVSCSEALQLECRRACSRTREASVLHSRLQAQQCD